jgi:hypothetical protein
MSTPNIEAQPGKDHIPNGTKRIIIFDTNAYRVLTAKTSLADCRAKATQLRQREQAAGVFVLASPTVIWELVAHLADPNDPGYEHCLNSLVVLGEHAVDPNKPAGGIKLFPDADSIICRELFHALPPGHEEGIQNLGSFVKHVVKYAPDLSDPRAQQIIKQIASGVDATEKQWVSSMQAVVARCDPNVAKQFFGNASTSDVRKNVRGFFSSSAFMNMWAGFMVEIHANKVGYVLANADELKAKIQVMLEVFSVPFHLMSVLLQKIASDPAFNVANPKRKRWNFVWDSQLAFSIGNDHEIAGVPAFFVTGDGELIEAATTAKCGSRVLSLNDYLASVGFP